MGNLIRPLLLSAATVLLTGAYAQQDPMYTMYMWNTLSVNPGYAGSADLFTASALMRKQWVGLAGAPSTQTLTAHAPLPLKSLGLGLSVMNENVGPVRTTQVFADFAYRIRITRKARLAFGLKAGVEMFQADLLGLQNVDTDDPYLQQNITGKVKPNFGFGAYYWGSKGYIGLSAPKLLRNTWLRVDGNTSGNVEALQQEQHYFLIGGYVFDLGPEVKLRPGFLLKAVQGAPLQLDLSTMVLLRERFWIGAAYRHGDSMDALVAYQVTDQLRVGYAYDLSLTRLRTYNSGSHELMLTYDLRFDKKRMMSPRYF
ncbi:MAG TPA: type IX secretion system membrane protein PorP/SprF [Flavobacteriales bacterium]